jgi:hypothetical protein
VSEEASQQALPALHGVSSAACSMGQSVKIKGGIVREGIGFQIGPQVLDGIEFRGIGREVFQVCRTRQDALLDEFALVSLEAIPDEDDGRVQLTLQMLKEVHGALSVDIGIGMEPKVQRDPISVRQHAQRRDGRDLMLRPTALAQHRRVSAHAPGAAHQRRHEHPGFVEENDARPQAGSVFFTRGQSCSIQVRMRSSSRSTARRVGFWGENPKPCSRRLTCAG